MSARNASGGRPLWPASIRLRLTLWNVGVLALMLAGLGVGLRYTLKATLIASVDRGLVHVGRNIQSRVASVGLTGLAPGPGFGASAPPSGRLRPRILDMQGHLVLPVESPVPHDSAPYDSAAFQRALAGRQSLATIRLAGQPVRLLSVPLQQNGSVVGVAQVPRPLTETYQEVRRLTDVMLLLAAPALLIAGLGGAFLTSRALRPVRQITHAAGRIGAEDLSGRLPAAGRDELSELAATFNGLLGRLEEAFGQRAAAYAELERAYEQQRRFTADASHELKTPLTVIEGTVSLALSGQRTAAQYRQSLETVGRSAEMMTKIVQDLLLLAQSDAGQLVLDRRVVSVSDVLALAREAASGREHAPVVLTDVDPQLTVSGDPSHLVRLFVNLLDNAARHTPPEGRIEMSASGDTMFVMVTVKDTGAGIAPEHLPHVFERFYRVDAARARRHGGSGLGLAICRSIVEAHGGTLSIESVVGEGTVVRVRLPQAVMGGRSCSFVAHERGLVGEISGARPAP